MPETLYNIKNAINLPYSSFSEDSFLNFKIKNTNKKIVVHCMYSSMRGPVHTIN